MQTSDTVEESNVSTEVFNFRRPGDLKASMLAHDRTTRCKLLDILEGPATTLAQEGA
jgi:hypothetical protein